MKKRIDLKSWLRNNWITILVLFLAALIGIGAWLILRPQPEPSIEAEEFAEYENGIVTHILADNTQSDPVADGAYRGEQLIIVDVKTGRYAGQSLQASNFVGPLYGVPLSVGDEVTLIISTYADGTNRATVYEYSRATPLLWVIALFVIATLAVGGKTGAKSLVGLAVTLLGLYFILIPALFRGLPTLPTVFFVCAYVSAVSLILLGGVRKKTMCAMLGAIAGTLLAMVFGLIAQKIVRIDGMRLENVEPLLQIRQSGGAIRLRGLLVGGVIISALGAVMDVTMSLASSLTEVKAANPELTARALMRSGMNIGRDMVGTMTNTLILAFLGSDLALILYLYSIGLQPNQLLSSPFLAIEVVSGISSSIGMILAIPITVVITSLILSKKRAGSVRA